MRKRTPDVADSRNAHLLYSESARNNFAYRIFQFSNLLNSIVELHLRTRFSLGLRDAHLLSLINRQPDLHSQDLARMGGIDKASVSRSLAKLAQRQLIRIVPGANDHRYRTYAFTDSGAATAKAVRATIQEVNQQLQAGLGKAEHTVLDTLLNRVAETAFRELEANQDLVKEIVGRKK